MSPVVRSLSPRSSLSTSPETIVVLSHVASVSESETTYFGMALMNGPKSSSAWDGQYPAHSS